MLKPSEAFIFSQFQGNLTGICCNEGKSFVPIQFNRFMGSILNFIMSLGQFRMKRVGSLNFCRQLNDWLI